MTDLREKLKMTIASLDEIDAAYGKSKLASKLGCKASELTNRSMDIAPDKIGRVIGKSGATIKQVEAEQKVILDVNSVSGVIHFTGSEAAVELAMMEVEKICKAIDVDMNVSTELVSHFTNKVCMILCYCVLLVSIRFTNGDMLTNISILTRWQTFEHSIPTFKLKQIVRRVSSLSVVPQTLSKPVKKSCFTFPYDRKREFSCQTRHHTSWGSLVQRLID